MKTAQYLTHFLKRIPAYPKLSPCHISLYMALLCCFESGKQQHPFHVSRSKLMKLSAIKSIATYHKCLKQLIALGFIRYAPSYHPKLASLVWLLSEYRPNQQ